MRLTRARNSRERPRRHLKRLNHLRSEPVGSGGLPPSATAVEATNSSAPFSTLPAARSRPARCAAATPSNGRRMGYGMLRLPPARTARRRLGPVPPARWRRAAATSAAVPAGGRALDPGAAGPAHSPARPVPACSFTARAEPGRAVRRLLGLGGAGSGTVNPPARPRPRPSAAPTTAGPPPREQREIPCPLIPVPKRRPDPTAAERQRRRRHGSSRPRDRVRPRRLGAVPPPRPPAAEGRLPARPPAGDDPQGAGRQRARCRRRAVRRADRPRHLGGDRRRPRPRPGQVVRLFAVNRPMTSTKLVRRPTRGAIGNGLRVVTGGVLASGGTLSGREPRRPLHPRRRPRQRRDGGDRGERQRRRRRHEGDGGLRPCPAARPRGWLDGPLRAPLRRPCRQTDAARHPSWYDPAAFAELVHAAEPGATAADIAALMGVGLDDDRPAAEADIAPESPCRHAAGARAARCRPLPRQLRQGARRGWGYPGAGRSVGLGQRCPPSRGRGTVTLLVNRSPVAAPIRITRAARAGWRSSAAISPTSSYRPAGCRLRGRPGGHRAGDPGHDRGQGARSQAAMGRDRARARQGHARGPPLDPGRRAPGRHQGRLLRGDGGGVPESLGRRRRCPPTRARSTTPPGRSCRSCSAPASISRTSTSPRSCCPTSWPRTRTWSTDWDVVYDARGHLIEPHTGASVPVGTLQVRDYLLPRRLEPRT